MRSALATLEPDLMSVALDIRSLAGRPQAERALVSILLVAILPR
jgi:hypothetical protein